MSNIRALPLAALWLFQATAAVAYDVRAFKPRAASEYRARQDFQNVVIGARPFLTDEAVQALFDTDKLLEKEILPVLVVVENNNDFAIRILGEEVYLAFDRGNLAPIPFFEVLLHIELKKPPSTYSTRPELLARQTIDPKMLGDFERKAFLELMLAPGETGWGVLFYWMPEEGGLSGARLYLPKVWNINAEEPLMFFEFDLGGAQ